MTQQGGIGDLLRQVAVQRCPPQMQHGLLSNIVLTGGNAKFGGFSERVKFEFEEQGRLPPMLNQVNVTNLEIENEQ